MSNEFNPNGITTGDHDRDHPTRRAEIERDETPKQVLFRLPAWERQNFDDLCHELSVSQQAALTEACRDWMKTKRKMLDHAFLQRMAREGK